MGRGLYGQLTVEDWLEDASRIPLKGISLKNIDYVMDINKASIELGRTATLNYFLLTRLNIYNCRNMMKSAVAQRSFCRKVIVDLNRYEVDGKYDKAFKRLITALFNRSNYIYRIVQENLKLTRYWWHEDFGNGPCPDYDAICYAINIIEEAPEGLDNLIKALEAEHKKLREMQKALPEIIYCKDCKHHWTHKCMDSMPIERCDLEQTFYDAEHDFCSLAERRTDG